MKNFVAPGEYIEVILAAAVVSGAGRLIVDLFGFATKSGEIGDKVNFALEGVFSHAKAAVAFTQGEKIYWDDTAKVLTTVAMGNKLVGAAHASALSGDATGQVRLNETTTA